MPPQEKSPDISLVPDLPGSYALRLVLAETVTAAVGHLGNVVFPAGTYLYSGSAFGPGGLRARLRHHLNVPVRLHWHIDYLRLFAVVRGGWYCTASGSLECAWSQALVKNGARIPVPRFGATDCKNGCQSHLVLFQNDFDESLVVRVLRTAAPGNLLATLSKKSL